MVGCGTFHTTPAGEWDPGSAAAPGFADLPSVASAVGELARVLTRLPGVSLHGTGPLLDRGLEEVSTAWRAALQGPAGQALVVHVTGHGVTAAARSTLYVPVPGTDPGRLPETALGVHRWLDDLEDSPDAAPTLLLLDVCGAGRAVVHQLAQQVQTRQRKAWVVAAAAEDQRAYAARFTRATAAVLDRLREGWLDVSPLLAHVPVETLAEEIDRELARRHTAGRGSGFTQTVVRTSRTEATAEPPPFFPNPAHSDDPVARLHGRVERALWQFATEADPGLDPMHFLSRASGRPVGGQSLTGCLFTGREPERARLSAWLDDPAGTEPPLLVVTGGPGTGKSALLGVTVCLTHPQLREITGTVRSRIPLRERPREHPRLAAVHARRRTPRQVLESVARQLGLGAAPAGGWSTAALLDRLDRRQQRAVVVVDALDEAERPEELLDRVLLPMVAAGRLCRVAVATRPWYSRFPALFAAAREYGGPLDLDTVPRDRLERELSGYVEELLWTAPGYATGDTGRRVSAALAEQLAGSADSGGFLMAGLFADHLAALGHPLAPEEAVALLPEDLPGMLELHLDTLTADSPWLRPVLSAVAHGHGEGMPFDVVRAAAPAFRTVRRGAEPEEPSRRDIRRALDTASFYLRTSTDRDGRQLYRFFHQRLTEHLRASSPGAAPEVLRRLLDMLPVAGGAGRAWQLAPPYLLRHAMDHAAEAGASAVDGLLLDPGFLVHAAPEAVAAHLHRAAAPGAVRNAAVLRTSASSAAAHHGPQARRALLAVDAARWGQRALAEAIGGAPVAGSPALAAVPRWATNGLTHPALRHTLAGLGAGAAVLAATPVGGRPHAVTGGRDGTVRVWDLTDGTLRHTLTGHQMPEGGGSVGTATLSSVGGRPHAVTGGRDGTVRVWDLTDGTLRHTLTGHRGPVTAATALPGPALAATAGRDGTLRIWNLADGAPRQILTGHQGPVTAVTVTTVEGHPLLVTAGHDGTVRLWDPSATVARRICRGYGGRVLGLATADAGGRPYAVSAGHDGAVRVWDLTDGTLRHTLDGGRGWATAVVTTEVRGRPWVLATDDHGTVRVWDLADGTLRHTLTGHRGLVAAAAVAAVGGRPHAVTGGHDGTVRVWDLADGTLRHTLTGHQGPVEAAVIAPVDGRPHAVTAGRDGTARVWDLTDGVSLPPPPVLPAHGGPVTAAAVVRVGDRSCAVTTGADGTVRVRDLGDGTPVHTLTGHRGPVTALVTADLGGQPCAVTAGRDALVRVWDLADGSERQTLMGSAQPVLAVARIDGWPYALVGGQGPLVQLWDVTEGGLRHTFDVHRAPVTAAAVARVDGRVQAVTTDERGIALVWDLAEGTLRHTLDCGGEWLTGVAVAVRSRRPCAVTAGQYGTVRVWNLTDGTLRHTLTGHRGPVTALTTADLGGRPHTLSAGADGTVRVWDLTDGTLRHTLTGHHGPVTALTTARTAGGGLRAAAGDEEGTVQLWDLTPDTATVTRLALPLPVGALALCDSGLLAGFGPETAFLAWTSVPDSPWRHP